MNTVHKSYKYRMYPTKSQMTLLAKHFGSTRLVYNHFLNRRKVEYLENETTLNYYACASELTELKVELPFLKEVNSQSLQQSLRQLDVAYNRFFKKQSQFPSYKKKTSRNSFTVPQKFKVEEGKLYIPKFREGIEVNVHRELVGKPLFATVSQDPDGRYYVSVTVETTHEPFSPTGKSVGIDTGLSGLAILSDGTIYPNPKNLKRGLKKLKFLQRQHSKKVKGSVSRKKSQRKLAKHHKKVANRRLDYLHKTTTEIVKNHDLIVVEDLAVKNLMKNHHLAQSFSDVALGKFYELLEYKSAWNNRTFVRVDRFFPSSKTCSTCGWIKDDLTLQIRSWTCPSCGETHNRDLNAAKNILLQGEIIQSVCGTQSDSKQKRVEATSIDVPKKPEAHFL